MAIKIYYPSGNTATVHAKFMQAGPGPGDTFLVAFEITQFSRVAAQKLEAGQVLMVDPRCVCVDTITGATVYNGRDHLDQISTEFKEWLNEHPEWPGTLKLDQN